MKKLVVFRLYDPSYSNNSEYGNKETLSAVLLDDNTLTYILYSGWQDSGTPMSISNLQLKQSLPLSISGFKRTFELTKKIVEILKTGVGSHAVHVTSILNEIAKPKKPSKPNQKLVNAVIEDLKRGFTVGDYTVLEELLFFIPKKNLIQALPEEDWKKYL